MRVYQYVSAEHGLENIEKRRIKVSRLADMNDPFEMFGAHIESPETRVRLRR